MRSIAINFFHFINQYRINYAANLLEEGVAENYTMEAIGKQAGFNSKTTFHTHFKKWKGVSPGDFKKEIRKLNN